MRSGCLADTGLAWCTVQACRGEKKGGGRGKTREEGGISAKQFLLQVSCATLKTIVSANVTIGPLFTLSAGSTRLTGQRVYASLAHCFKNLHILHFSPDLFCIDLTNSGVLIRTTQKIVHTQKQTAVSCISTMTLRPRMHVHKHVLCPPALFIESGSGQCAASVLRGCAL